jgi:hypothetical protein
LARRLQLTFTVVAVVTGFSFLVNLGYGLEWTGLGPARVPQGVRPAKTAWDWATLILPLYTAFIVTYFGNQVSRRQLDVEQERARQAEVQTYVDQTLSLLANEDPQGSQRSEELRVLLRARTRMVLARIGTADKKSVVRFLHDAGLILGEQPAVRLDGADLREAALARSSLSGANLSEADLRRAHLWEADLSKADLREADLRGAHLQEANLEGAHKYWLTTGWRQRRERQPMTAAELEQQAKSLEGATMPNGQKYEHWLKDQEGNKKDAEND